MRTIKSELSIPVDDSLVFGNLNLVENEKGLVIFAHGSGSSRFSKRNNFVADKLHEAQFSTLLFDLLTQQEEEVDQVTREFRFNILLLAERLVQVTNWVEADKISENVPVGYFGASTGAAAALIASARMGHRVNAVVSRGGRPDLAGEYLKKVVAPTLLVVGERDTEVITLNKQAYEALLCEKKMVLVPDATHLFEEPDTLLEATKYAIDWFNAYLKK